MSFNKRILNSPNKEKKNLSELKLFFLEKSKTDIKSKSKLFSLEKIPNKKILFKVKLNFPIKNLNFNFFNKSKRNKLNNKIDTSKNNENFYIMNYNDKNNQPLSPINNHFTFSNKLINDAYHLNNTNNDKPKILLPNIDLPNQKKIPLIIIKFQQKNKI